MALSEYDITYVSRHAIKGSALADHLAYHPLAESQPLSHEFPNEHIMLIEDKPQFEDEWMMWFDEASNILGNRIGVILASPTDQYFPFAAKLGFDCTNNMAEYEACTMWLAMALEHQVKRLQVYEDSTLVIYQLRGEWETRDIKLIPYHDYVKEMIEAFDAISFHHVPCEENQMADALATLPAMIRHLSLEAAKADQEPWYLDIKRYLEKGEYPEGALENSKRTLRRLAAGYLLSGKAERIIEEVHEGTFGTHASGHTLARKILRAGYCWTKLESNCHQHVRKCLKCQIHANRINVAPSTLHNLTSPWPFSM
ncbi:rnhA, partial [Mucuna pruriens]